MTPLAVAIAVGVVVLWLVKQVVGTLIGLQVKGSIPDYVADRARAAARRLPDDLAAEYEEDWLAELETLEGKPIDALRFAAGLSRAARSIAGASTAPDAKLGVSRVFSRVADAVGARLHRLSPAFFSVGVFAAMVVSVVVALRAHGPLPAIALESTVVYRLELGLISFFSLYIPLVVFTLALRGKSID